jgi:hypothetical protein
LLKKIWAKAVCNSMVEWLPSGCLGLIISTVEEGENILLNFNLLHNGITGQLLQKKYDK